jgi:hypothetical protein
MCLSTFYIRCMLLYLYSFSCTSSTCFHCSAHTLYKRQYKYALVQNSSSLTCVPYRSDQKSLNIHTCVSTHSTYFVPVCFCNYSFSCTSSTCFHCSTYTVHKLQYLYNTSAHSYLVHVLHVVCPIVSSSMNRL